MLEAKNWGSSKNQDFMAELHSINFEYITQIFDINWPTSGLSGAYKSQLNI